MKLRLKRINKESVNVDNYADEIASIHLANVEKHILKLEVYLVEVRKNTLVAFHLHHQTY